MVLKLGERVTASNTPNLGKRVNGAEAPKFVKRVGKSKATINDKRASPRLIHPTHCGGQKF